MNKDTDFTDRQLTEIMQDVSGQKSQTFCATV